MCPAILVGEPLLQSLQLAQKLDRPLALLVDAALPELNVTLAATEALSHLTDPAGSGGWLGYAGGYPNWGGTLSTGRSGALFDRSRPKRVSEDMLNLDGLTADP
jgi:hypothetical protein